jgi:hypothetical protein
LWFVGLFPFLTKYENKKTHNIIFLMLEPRFKSLHIISSFVGQEQGVSFVEKYHKSFYMLGWSDVMNIFIL